LWPTIRALMSDMPMLALLPGALTVGLTIMAVRTARAATFGPTEKPHWGEGRPPAVTDWLEHREAHSHPPAKSATPALAAPKPRA
jgi:hypothetical protein